MHKIVLYGIAALALLALVTGGRGKPVEFRLAAGARPVCHGRVAKASTHAVWPLSTAEASGRPLRPVACS